MASINEVLEGHVALEIECVDRLYLNAYVPNLQVGGQVIRFLPGHLGYEVPSPALLARSGTASASRSSSSGPSARSRSLL